MNLRNAPKELEVRDPVRLACTWSRILLCALGISATGLAGVARSAEAELTKTILDIAGGWKVSFDPVASTLECRHESLGVCLSGPLLFTAIRDGKRLAWSVEFSRDLVAGRLALVDERKDVQGYVALVGDSLRMSLTLVQRPPQNYGGELRFTPAVSFGEKAFACRTRFGQSAVVQMASGPADSRLNDSLFDAEHDMLLRFTGQDVVINTEPAAAGRPIHFQASLGADVAQSDTSTITVELMPDYYRSRYAPYYRLIDRKRCPSAPTGWMAWNVYFDAATEDDNLAEARVGAKFLKPYGLEFWSVESWQENSPRLPVKNFHNLTMRSSLEKFPHGMKWLADQIRALGLRPGLWTVSFGTGDEAFYQAHRDWFLHHPDGRPMTNWNGRFVLDPSQAAVRQYTEETYRKMATEWGYEFFKSDGMSDSAHFFERPEVRAAFHEPCEDPYGKWIESLRRGIGPDRVLLACQGHYTGPDIAWCDAGRIDGDLVRFPKPPDWMSYLRQAQATQRQLFVNNIVWYNDPDTLMVGDFSSLDTARLATTVVALPGQLTFFGDKLTQLSPERMRLLQQTLPVCDVHPLDLAPLGELAPVWDLKVRRTFGSWDVVSLFNWGEEPRTLRVTFADLGLDSKADYLLYDFWSQKLIGSRQGEMELRVEPHSNRLLAVHARLDRPQLVSTDRHISQGGVELTDASWNAEESELDCMFKLVANDRLTAFFHVPASFVLVKATAEGATVEASAMDAAPMLLVTLRRDTSGEARLRLKFRENTP
jgi:hypothetical protein